MNPPKGHKLVPRSTPLHVFQLIMQLLKITVNTLTEDTFPYHNIDFDTTYNKESLKLGKKPLIVVSCGDAIHGQLALQDLADMELRTMNSYKTAMVSSSVIIKVISPTKTEVEIIGNEVFNFLIAIRVLLPELTTIKRVSGITMSQVNKVYRDLPHYYVQCSMSYDIQYLWSHIVNRVLLENIYQEIIPTSITT